MLHKEDLLQMISSHTEDEIRAMLCRWLDCGTPDKTPCPEHTGVTPLVTIQGTVENDGFYFRTALNGQGVSFHLDTGAFEMLLTKDIADELNLPNDGPLQVAGVTGSSEAYQSHVTVDLGDGHVYEDVHCVVDPAFTGTPLFGFRFVLDHHLAITVNPVAQTVAFLPA